MQFSRERAVVLAAATASFGLAAVLRKLAIDRVPPLRYQALSSIVYALTVPMFAMLATRYEKAGPADPVGLAWMIAATCVGLVGNLLFGYALRASDDVGITTAICSTSPVITLMIAFLFLQERPTFSGGSRVRFGRPGCYRDLIEMNKLDDIKSKIRKASLKYIGEPNTVDMKRAIVEDLLKVGREQASDLDDPWVDGPPQVGDVVEARGSQGLILEPDDLRESAFSIVNGKICFTLTFPGNPMIVLTTEGRETGHIRVMTTFSGDVGWTSFSNLRPFEP